MNYEPGVLCVFEDSRPGSILRALAFTYGKIRPARRAVSRLGGMFVPDVERDFLQRMDHPESLVTGGVIGTTRMILEEGHVRSAGFLHETKRALNEEMRVTDVAEGKEMICTVETVLNSLPAAGALEGREDEKTIDAVFRMLMDVFRARPAGPR